MTNPPQSPRQDAWNRSLAAHPGELDMENLKIEGEIPLPLRGGRYLLNGPGWVQIGDRLVHPFDGHGYVRAISLDAQGRAHLKARFVQTPAYQDEKKQGKLVHRGLATNPSKSWWQNWRAPGPRNVANTTLVSWAGKLLCGWEGGRPYALDPHSLETVGESDFKGNLPAGAFLAHMRIDPMAQRLVGLSIAMSRQTTLTFREFDTQENCVHTREVALPKMVLAHDFVITPHWYILAGNQLDISIGGFMSFAVGAGTLFEAVRSANPAQGCLYLIPRQAGPLRVITLDGPLFAVHFANAYETDTAVTVDICAFEHFEFGNEFGYQNQELPLDPAIPDQRPPQHLIRLHIPAEATTAQRQVICPLGCDFPRVGDHLEGQPAPAVYVATRQDPQHSDPFDSVARINLQEPYTHQSWQAPEHHFVGEPVFAPSPENPQIGWVLAMIYDGLGERSQLAIFESENITAGPIARIHLPLLPYGFHGAWEALR